MKISLRLPNGATLEFEGDKSEFERLSKFLESPPDSLAAEVVPVGSTGGGAASGAISGQASLEPAAVLQRLDQVGVNNDQERVTVMAQLAMDTGKEGIDYATLNHLYTELALRKPAQFPTKALANAKSSGLVRMVKPGIWRTTFRGENFAKGLGRGERAAPRRSSSRTQASNDGEGKSK